MYLTNNKIKKQRKSCIDKNNLNSIKEKISLISNENTNISLENRSLIFDVTYNLFTKKNNNNNKKYNKIKLKIKKIEAPLINNIKYRNKTTNIRIYTDFSKKKCNHLNQSIKKQKSEIMENKQLSKYNKSNKMNSIIININNSQYNKIDFENDKVFRNTINSKINEKYFNEKKEKKKLINKNNDYFYDFSLNKNIITDNGNKNKNNYANTYNVGNKPNNYHKIKTKLNKSNTKEKLCFKLSQKNPIKLKTNIIGNKMKNKSYIQKKSYNKSINNESNLNNNTLHKLFYSKSYNQISKEKKYLTNKKIKTAEKNYLEKWQLINRINFNKKYSLSYIHSKKSLTKLPKTYINLGKNNTLSHRQNNNRNNNIKIINTDMYNNTEVNEAHKKKDYFCYETLQNKKLNNFEIENKECLGKNILSKEESINTNNISQDGENEIKNDKIVKNKMEEIDNLNKIIERKKREIDLLNVMKFTTEIYNSNKKIENFDKNEYTDINSNNIDNYYISNNATNDNNIKCKNSMNLMNIKNKNYNAINDYDNNLHYNNFLKDNYYSLLNNNNEISDNKNYKDLNEIINIDSNHSNKID